PMHDQSGGFVARLLDQAHYLCTAFGHGSLDKSLDQAPGFRAAATDALNAGLWALPEEQSTALRICYRATHPEVAQRVLKVGTEEAISQWENVMAPKESRSFLRERLKASTDEEASARKELNEFLAKHGATDYSEELTQLASGLARLSIEIEVWRSTLESDHKE